jgi:hypothetical protein
MHSSVEIVLLAETCSRQTKRHVRRGVVACAAARAGHTPERSSPDQRDACGRQPAQCSRVTQPQRVKLRGCSCDRNCRLRERCDGERKTESTACQQGGLQRCNAAACNSPCSLTRSESTTDSRTETSAARPVASRRTSAASKACGGCKCGVILASGEQRYIVNTHLVVLAVDQEGVCELCR